MTLPPEAPTGPWARVWGRVIVPDANPRGPGGGSVAFDPDPDVVSVDLGEGRALVASRTLCEVDAEGYLVGPSRERFVDLVVPGPGVFPEGQWTYRMTVRLPHETTRVVRVSLVRGSVVALADLVPVAEDHGTVPPPSGDVSGQVAEARAAAQGARTAAEAAARDLAAVRADVAAGKVKGEKGDDAREPAFTVSAKTFEAGLPASAVLSGAYPDLALEFGVPRGAPGADGKPGAKGSDAREPVFTASATALGEEAQPTAVLSGTYPYLTIDFGIPRGKTGAPGTGGGGGSHPLLLSGPGRPDVPSTTGGVITGSEAVGTEYRSTDGAGVGAWVWMRRPTGWVVTDGDTGWRDVTSDSTIKTFDPGTLYIRRLLYTVYVRFSQVMGGGKHRFGSPGQYQLLAHDSPVLAGFRLDVTRPAESVQRADGSGVGVLIHPPNAKLESGDSFLIYHYDFVAGTRGLYVMAPNAAAARSATNARTDWLTADSWPTTLPGLPV